MSKMCKKNTLNYEYDVKKLHKFSICAKIIYRRCIVC